MTLRDCQPIYARLRFRGAGFVGLAIFATYRVPTSLQFIPMLQVVKTLHLQDNFLSLILIYPTFMTPLCTWLMAGYFKTIPAELEECATILGAQRQADDSVTITSLGGTYLGELDGRVSERVQTAADTFRFAGIPTEAREDIQRVLWSKACNATGVFGVTVLTRVSNDRLFSDAHLMRAYLALVRETAAVAAASGVQVGDYAGFPPIRTFVDTDDQVTIDQLRPAARPDSPRYASMTSDLLAGRPLEVDAIFGDMVQRVERSAVSVPCLRLVRDLIRGVDPAQ